MENEEKQIDYELHLEAGLVDAGLDEDGDQEWTGNIKAWNKYKELYKEHLEK